MLPAGDPAAFVLAETAVARPPLVPEIRLHLAGEVTPLWLATEARLAAVNLPPPYWAFAWAGGQALARHVLDHPALVAGRRVLDLGAGSGLLALAAARAGAGEAAAAEIDPFALAAIRLNAALNGLAVTILFDDILDDDAAGWDTVLVGDMCYERPLAARVFAWLGRARAAGATVLLGDPGRAYLPGDGLAALATYAVPVSRELEDRDLRETTVYRLDGAGASGASTIR